MNLPWLLKTVRAKRWVLGAVNFDEDLHFSSFYLRASSTQFSTYKKFAYPIIIAFFEDFHETYFIPADDCQVVAQQALNCAVSDPDWLSTLIEEIYVRSTHLEEVFEHWPMSNLRVQPQETLIGMYRRHRAAQRRLYAVARIPETLDRGAGLFTSYLRSQVLDLSTPDCSARALNATFLKLTTPSRPSVLQEAQAEWAGLVTQLRARFRPGFYPRSAARLLLELTPTEVQAIEHFRTTWGIFDYHGYGTRDIPPLTEYVRRLLDDLIRGESTTLFAAAGEMLPSEQEDRGDIDTSGIDLRLRRILALYGDIGLAKLYRRRSQLLAFYYLDGLLAEIARRLALPESHVRCMLPEEIEGALLGRGIPADLADRRNLTAYVITRTRQFLLTQDDARELREVLDGAREVPEHDGRRLLGLPASPGTATGTARVLFRMSDLATHHFHNGDILITEATDPDLLPIISRAGGVATQQGGVTAHASIICRELGKPALVGIPDLLNHVADGDEVTVNADEGWLEVLSQDGGKLVVRPEQVNASHGQKAVNLQRLLHAGFTVPAFFVVPWEPLLTASHEEGDSLLAIQRAIWSATQRLQSGEVAIRSSATTEDLLTASGAGRYPSYLHVSSGDVASGLLRFIRELSARGLEAQYRGSVIVQEMVSCDIAGVCFTANPMDGDRSIVVIEASVGRTDSVTAGRGIDARILLRKVDLEIASIEGTDGVAQLRQSLLPMARAFIAVEQLFGFPQDIEWLIHRDKVVVLQARPLTTPIQV